MTALGGNGPRSEPFLARMQEDIGDNLNYLERREEPILRLLNDDDENGRACGVLARMQEDIGDNLYELERKEESISRLLLGGGRCRNSSNRSSSSLSLARPPQERVVGGCESPMASFEPPRESYPEDGRVIGTDAIFSSSNVIPPTNEKGGGVIPIPPSSPPLDDDGDDGIPAPSIYYDVRGEIHNVRVNGKYRISILYTRAGYLRSGDLHPNEQCDFVFSGKVRVWTLAENGSTTKTTYGQRSFISIPRGVPHVFEFVEDTVMAEWWEPRGYQAWFYGPYRDIVHRSMMIARGRDDDDADGEGGTIDGLKKGLVVLIPRTYRIRTTGIVILAATVGVLGFALGSRFGARR